MKFFYVVFFLNYLKIENTTALDICAEIMNALS